MLIAAQNNTVRTNHIRERMDKTQQNSECWLCGDRDETINHIISECSKFAQKEYKIKKDRVGKVIHRELCKKFKFDHMKKFLYAQTNICTADWHTQMSLGFWHPNRSLNLSQTTRPYNNQQKKENLQNCGLCSTGWPQSKIKRMWEER